MRRYARVVVRADTGVSYNRTRIPCSAHCSGGGWNGRKECVLCMDEPAVGTWGEESRQRARRELLLPLDFRREHFFGVVVISAKTAPDPSHEVLAAVHELALGQGQAGGQLRAVSEVCGRDFVGEGARRGGAWGGSWFQSPSRAPGCSLFSPLRCPHRLDPWLPLRSI